MKEASIGEPNVYLGGKVRKVELKQGRSVGLLVCLSMYVRLAIMFEHI